MQFDRNKPSVVGPVPHRSSPPTSNTGSPEAGLVQREPVYRVVLGCSFVSRSSRPDDRSTDPGETVRCA